MFEKALKGNNYYWMWLAFLGLIIAIGFVSYLRQYFYGLGITGMGRDVSWGLYIAQFTFLVGVAAGGVMLVLPYYIHNFRAFGRITILGEFLAIAALLMCVLFIFVDLGQPLRAFNVMLHPTPSSMLFSGYVRASGLHVFKHSLRLGDPDCRTQAGGSTQMDISFCVHIHSFCYIHSYRYRHAVLRFAGSAFLAFRHYRSPLFGLGLCCRTGTHRCHGAYFEAGSQFRCRQRGN